MKQIPLAAIVLFLLTGLLTTSCKKSADDSTSTTTYQLYASINGTTWTPDTLNATVTYNSATKTKILSITGTQAQKRLNLAITLSNAGNSKDFTTGTYTVDATGNPVMTYSSQQKDAGGNYVFVPVTTAGNGDGSIVITTVDSASGLLTGTFSFTTKKINYDNDGNAVSVHSNVISSGSFTNLPYTFVSN